MMSSSESPDNNSIDDAKVDNKAMGEDLDAYGTQYFGFTPRAFTNGLYNAFCDYLNDGMNAMGEFLLQKFPNLVTQEEIDTGIDGIMKDVQTPMNSTFDKLESYLGGNILKIPENVVLPEDEVQLKGSYTKEEEASIDKEIKELREKILAAKYKNSVIVQDLKKMETVRTTQTYVLHQLDQLHNILAESGVASLSEAVSSTCSHTKKLLETMEDTELMNDSSSTNNQTEVNEEENDKLLKLPLKEL